MTVQEQKKQEEKRRKVDEHNSILKKKNDSFYSFFKNIATISLGFIALFVSLRSDGAEDECVKIYFFVTTLLFGLCIVFSLVTQLGEVFLYEKLRVRLGKELQHRQQHPAPKYIRIKLKLKQKIYKLSEIGTYICLLLAIISLLLYVYFLTF